MRTKCSRGWVKRSLPQGWPTFLPPWAHHHLYVTECHRMCFPCVEELAEGAVFCMAHQQDMALPYWGLPSFPGVMDVLSLQLDPTTTWRCRAQQPSLAPFLLAGCEPAVLDPAQPRCRQELPPSCRKAAGGSGAAGWPPCYAAVSSTALAQLSLSTEPCLPGLPLCCKEGCSPFQTLKLEQKCVGDCSVDMDKVFMQMDAIAFP